MAFGYAEAAVGRWARTDCTEVTFECRNPLPVTSWALMRPGHSNPFLSPHWSETLAPLSLGSGVIRRLEWSALIWVSEQLFNWQYLVLCFLDTGFQGASYFSARSQISLKGFKITEAHLLPVRLRGAKELCTATRHYFKNTRLLTGRGRILATLCSFRAIKTMHYMSNCQTFQRGPFALSNNI